MWKNKDLGHKCCERAPPARCPLASRLSAPAGCRAPLRGTDSPWLQEETGIREFLFSALTWSEGMPVHVEELMQIVDTDLHLVEASTYSTNGGWGWGTRTR